MQKGITQKETSFSPQQPTCFVGNDIERNASIAEASGLLRGKEVWKDLVGYKGEYKISSYGRIKSLYKQKIIIQSTDKLGYKKISLYKKYRVPKLKNHKVHRLVLQTFVKNKKQLPCVNHIDNNPKNNKVSNLEWISYLDNARYKKNFDTQIKGEKVNTSKLKEKQVIEIRQRKLSIKNMSKKYNVTMSTIRVILKGKTWKYLL